MRTTRPGDRRRREVLDRAVQIASAEGLEGMSIGRLAADLAIPKSSVQALFPSKEDLQLATIDAAHDVFRSHVLDVAGRAEQGLPRLHALFDAWVDYLDVFDGGCFFTATAHEFDSRPGAVNDALRRRTGELLADVTEQLRLAQRLGELAADTDLDQLLFELHGPILEANLATQLLGDDAAPARARRAIHACIERASA